MHGILDYLTVAIFALAPGVVGLTGVASIVSYALAIIHLAMTVATKAPLPISPFNAPAGQSRRVVFCAW